MTDQWDEKAREIGDALNADGISYGGENVGDVINNIGWRIIAAALLDVYARGVEDSAVVCDAYADDQNKTVRALAVARAIRALKRGGK